MHGDALKKIDFPLLLYPIYSPTDGQDTIREMEIPPAQMVSSHKCALCNRSFASGTALGGHVGHHRLCKIIERKGELKDIVTFGKNKNNCSVCPRNFRCANSLLLHMDSHSEHEVRDKLGDSSRLVPSTRTALDYLRELFGCSFSTAVRGVEETEIALKIKTMEELLSRGQEGFKCKSLGKHQRSKIENHDSVWKTPTLRIEEPEKRSLRREPFVGDFNLNEVPSPEHFCLDEWSNRDGPGTPNLRVEEPEKGSLWDRVIWW